MHRTEELHRCGGAKIRKREKRGKLRTGEKASHRTGETGGGDEMCVSDWREKRSCENKIRLNDAKRTTERNGYGGVRFEIGWREHHGRN